MPRDAEPRLDRRARGAAVEAAARTYLLAAGLREIALNAQYRLGELDLVMRDDSGRSGAVVVFVEVRYRRSSAFGGGAASVDAIKQRKLVHAAECFLLAHRQYAQSPCRFDVIEADGDPAAPRMHWLKDAFRADN